jgi:hypothetical protein
VNLTISIVAVVSIFSLPTMKFSAEAGLIFVAVEVSAATSRGGPLSFSFRT